MPAGKRTHSLLNHNGEWIVVNCVMTQHLSSVHYEWTISPQWVAWTLAFHRKD